MNYGLCDESPTFVCASGNCCTLHTTQQNNPSNTAPPLIAVIFTHFPTKAFNNLTAPLCCRVILPYLSEPSSLVCVCVFRFGLNFQLHQLDRAGNAPGELADPITERIAIRRCMEIK